MAGESIPEPVKVRLHRGNTAVIVVDMQNDFCKPSGKLFVPASVETIPKIVQVLERARQSDVMIVYTQDWHMKDDPEFAIWGEHALEGSWGAEIVDELRPRVGDVVVKKLRYDAFYGTSLDHILRLRQIENIVVTGTVANICVLHTAGSAALRWYKVYLPIDCVSALNDFDYRATLRQVSFLYRGILTRSELLEFEK
uniref:Isochorismatase n=1 Tax=Caldiarchaeum subterraneum TaxID=311458 RepID=E6N993_CALS0|nr:isochorismatase [Candidatus Caldarchaeum subterraneum]BAJ49745.1 isochorismatase [Candidatus Caldarchaeum subterraneum]